MKIVIIIVVVVVAVIGLGFFLFKQSEVPKDRPGTAIPILGAEHIDQGSKNHPPYNSNPPTSGWHWPQPAPWGAYDTPLDDEQAIHNLEHGGIWISYKPAVDADTVTKLKDFARRYRKIIVSPRDANDANIALVSWGRLQNLDQYDETAILKFIDANYNKAPEPGAP